MKRQVVETVINIMARDGLHHSTIAGVALRSGISQGSINWHFGSRFGLLRAVALELMERLSFEVSIDPETSRKEKVIALVDRFVYLAKHEGNALQAANVLFSDGSFVRRWQSELNELILERRRVPGQLLKEAVEAGEIDPVSPGAFFEVMSGMMQGLHNRLQYYQRGADTATVYATMRRMALASLGLDESGQRLRPSPSAPQAAP